MAMVNKTLSEASREDYSDFPGLLREDWNAFYNEWQNLDPSMAWNVDCCMQEVVMNEDHDFNPETWSQNITPSSLSDYIEEDGSLNTYNFEYRQLSFSDSPITPSTPSSIRKGSDSSQSNSPTTTSTFYSTRAGYYASRSSPPTTISTPLTPPSMMVSTTSIFQQYSCRYCDQSFDRRHKLNRHEKLHTKPVRCPIEDCTHGVAKARDMNRHIMAQHPEHSLARPLLAQPSYKCPIAECEFSRRGFRRKDNLTRHMRNIHGEGSGGGRT